MHHYHLTTLITWYTAGIATSEVIGHEQDNQHLIPCREKNFSHLHVHNGSVVYLALIHSVLGALSQQ